MRLTCPQCHTEYDVPDSALAGRARTLRCSDCGTKFTAPAVPEVIVPEPAPEPVIVVSEPLPEIPPQAEIPAEPEASFEPVTEEPEPVIAETGPEPEIAAEPVAPISAVRPISASPRPAFQPAAPVAQKPNRGLGISVLLVLILIGIVLAEHRAIGHAWPPSLRLFNALGLH